MNNNNVVGSSYKIIVSNAISSLKNLNKELGITNTTLNSIGKSINNAFKTTKILAFAGVVKGLTEYMIEASKKQTEYIENLNLLQVAYGEVNSSGERLIDTINDITGIDQSGLTKSLGTYRQMASALGIAGDSANLLSEDLLKLQLDMASLYNLDFQRAGQILQVTLSGNTKSIRQLGGDITEATLQQTAWALGIEKTVEEMNRAEKTMLIYLTIEKQLSNANGDLARTYNSVANQTKVFKDQITTLVRQIGGLLIPVLRTLLPILNGILMAINTIIGSLLSLFGIDASDLASEFGTATGDILDMEDGLNGVASAAKEAKKSLRGFDKLNVIRTPDKSSGAGAGGGIGTGISSEMLNMLKEYDLHLDKIRSTADKVKRQILKTLGFTEELNEETGEWEWKYQGIDATIKGLIKWFKELNPLAKLFVSSLTIIGAYKTWSGIKKVITTLGNTKLLLPVATLFDGIFTSIDKIGKVNLAKNLNDWSSMLTIGKKLQTTLIGGVGVVAGLSAMNDGLKKIATTGTNTFNVLETGAGAFSTTISGGMIGASLGGATGGILGGLLGLDASLEKISYYSQDSIKDLYKFKDSTKGLFDEINQEYKEWNELIKQNNELLSKDSSGTDYYQRLSAELQNIVDKNGNIKTGYEERALVITNILNKALGLEIEIIDGQIVKYGELKNKIDEVILAKKNEHRLSVLEEEYNVAIEKQANAIVKNQKAKEAAEKAEKLYNEQLEKTAKTWGLTTEEVEKALKGQLMYNMGSIELNREFKRNIKSLEEYKDKMKENNKEFEKSDETLKGYNKTIQDYERVLGYSLSNNQKALDYYFTFERAMYEMSDKEQKKYLNGLMEENRKHYNELIANQDNYSEEHFNKLKAEYDEEYLAIETMMNKVKAIMKTKSEEIDDETIEFWRNLSTNSQNEFITEFNNLSPKIQEQLSSKLKEAGIDISNLVQSGINQNQPTIKPKIDTNSLLENVKKGMGAAFGLVFGANVSFKADGGFLNEGELFVAREAGAEMVGSINNKPAVANNDQIVESISQGVYRAMKSANGGNQPIIIEATGDTDGLLNFITFKEKQRKRQYDF